jgi:Fe-S cluster biosynthesis and repair protein YggX
MRMVFCVKLKKEAKGLAYAPMPGELGEKIFQNISEEAWQLWLKNQTLFINENRLNLMDPKARTFLQENMISFLFEDKEIKPTGFKAPE